MTTSPLTEAIPSYTSGTWEIDPIHSDISFSVRHMMVSKVRGRFSTFSGEIVTAEAPLDSSLTVSVDLSSIDTNNEQRDTHLRSADFFDVATHPAMTYRSTGVRIDGQDFELDGELTIHGITRSVPLHFELNGFGPDPYGGLRAGFTASGEINRSDFAISFNMPIDGGGVVIGDRVQINIEVEAVLKQDAS